jgi:hypothetical protein
MSADRILAALIAGVGIAALSAQFAVTSGRLAQPDAALALWQMAGYFTVLTNLLVTGYFAAIALGRRIRPGGAGGPVLWIAMTGVTYRALLSGLWSPQGLAWWADQGLHSATPVLTILWWLRFAPPARPDAARTAGWLLWPLAYCAYALARGTATGFWAYPFLDPGIHGTPGVARNIAGMVAAFAVLAAFISAVDARRISR